MVLRMLASSLCPSPSKGEGGKVQLQWKQRSVRIASGCLIMPWCCCVPWSKTLSLSGSITLSTNRKLDLIFSKSPVCLELYFYYILSTLPKFRVTEISPILLWHAGSRAPSPLSTSPAGWPIVKWLLSEMMESADQAGKGRAGPRDGISHPSRQPAVQSKHLTAETAVSYLALWFQTVCLVDLEANQRLSSWGGRKAETDGPGPSSRVHLWFTDSPGFCRSSCW